MLYILHLLLANWAEVLINVVSEGSTKYLCTSWVGLFYKFFDFRMHLHSSSGLWLHYIHTTYHNTN